MSIKLLGKELKLTAKSLTYWLVIGVIFGFIMTQIGMSLRVIQEPKPGEDGSYGMIRTENKELIQQQAYRALFLEYQAESYQAYPFGFYKEVKLDSKEEQTIRTILEKAAGKTIEELAADYTAQIEAAAQSNPGEAVMENSSYTFPLVKGHAFSQFEEDMQEVSGFIGKGSAYEKNSYMNDAEEPMTYEQARKQYRKIVEKDKVTGAYARMVCDYLGIILAIVPVFLAATVALRDRRAKAAPIIYSRLVSSIRLVGCRYSSTVLLLLIPVLLISLMPAVQSLVIADKLNATGSLLLFYQYIIGWTLPTILFVTGLGFLMTELFGGITAIAVQIIFWFFALFSSTDTLNGSVGWKLIPRFNTVGLPEVFEQIVQELIWNRLFYAGLGIIFLGVTILVFDYKRKGGRILGKSI
ncbi:ABC transporter permease [Enterococcus sp. LJL128]